MILVLAALKLPLTFLALITGSTCTLTGGNFFSFPHWWEYLPAQINDSGKCEAVFNPPGDLLNIILAIIDILLRLAGIAAVISIIIAGISYITSNGSADTISSARRRIINSLIGLLIVLIAAAVVSFIGNRLG